MRVCDVLECSVLQYNCNTHYRKNIIVVSAHLFKEILDPVSCHLVF